MKNKFEEELPLYEMVVDDTDRSGIRLLSIVDKPAIEMKGVAFNETGLIKEFQFKQDDDKRIIIGPAMIPDYKIKRKDKDGSKYYVVFSKDTITKLVEKFNSKGDNRRINVDHSKEMVDAFIMEDWIVEDEYYDKSKLYGFNVPVGTWMVKVKIEDEKFWKTQVKELGKYGFSIEGLLGEKAVRYTEESTISDIINSLNYNDLMELFKNLNTK